MTQSTQGILGERDEQLGASDRGVIKFRNIVMEAIEATLRGGVPKGILTRQRAGEIIRLHSFTGLRAPGTT